MLSSYLNITVAAEWAAFIAAIILLDKPTGRWRLFKIITLVTILLDAAGWYLSYSRLLYYNALPYNFLLLITVVLFISLLGGATPGMKKHSRWLMALFSLGWLLNFIFLQGMDAYNSYTEIAGNILLAGMSCFLFYALLVQEQYINLLRYEYAWLAIGLLLSAMGSMVLYLFLDYLQNYYNVTGIPLYAYINYTVNVFLYSCLIIAFVCRRKNTRPA
ncbi:hypothetical protein [Parafilimonas terrae]|uniref:YhhN-like protein n=1 Tax=Parafilimonas terrae TaxID=1465490 RepID=A0A1I5WAG6_9BACT|nr:hypothetical protein [Parafilimonas terrae]SFQ16699.1 hypothetical protein SAMN05444277_10659 [Parafilimonas terrae]